MNLLPMPIVGQRVCCFHKISQIANSSPDSLEFYEQRFDGYLMKRVFHSQLVVGWLCNKKVWLNTFCSRRSLGGTCADGDSIHTHATMMAVMQSAVASREDKLLFSDSRGSFTVDSCLCNNRRRKNKLIQQFSLSLLLSGTLRTSFLSGSAFNVTWHLAYPHRVS